MIPPHDIRLTPAETVYFNSICRERKTWSNADLVAVCHLARAFVQIDTLYQTLVKAGYISGGAMHPAHRQLEKITQTAMQLTRLLKLDPASRLGRARNNAARNGAFRRVREALEGLDGDLVVTAKG